MRQRSSLQAMIPWSKIVGKAVEDDAIADDEAFGFVAAPREDVGGDEEVAEWKAGDGAAVAVVVEDDLAEVVLSPTLFGGPGDFGPVRRALDPADADAADDSRRITPDGQCPTTKSSRPKVRAGASGEVGFSGRRPVRP
jgi:hypothetical protein